MLLTKGYFGETITECRRRRRRRSMQKGKTKSLVKICKVKIQLGKPRQTLCEEITTDLQ